MPVLFIWFAGDEVRYVLSVRLLLQNCALSFQQRGIYSITNGKFSMRKDAV